MVTLENLYNSLVKILDAHDKNVTDECLKEMYLACSKILSYNPSGNRFYLVQDISRTDDIWHIFCYNHMHLNIPMNGYREYILQEYEDDTVKQIADELFCHNNESAVSL